MAKKSSSEKAPQNEDPGKTSDETSNGNEEPNFSDPEDFVDDIEDDGERLHNVSECRVDKRTLSRMGFCPHAIYMIEDVVNREKFCLAGRMNTVVVYCSSSEEQSGT
jgi:hypothetical protein